MNIYNKFRSVEKIANKFSLSKRFDEPTYFSFRLDFSDRGDYVYNMANQQAMYDNMPHPLFSLDENSGKNISDVTMYSAIRYLEDANEPVRAEMLRDFISKFNTLQETFPYYFQQIDGINELLKIDPTKGQRITSDKKISIVCLEGLDLRMSYLLNLYKKIVWDDVYQRWILPDMMRYFTLKIYLAEFRTFHLPVFNERAKADPYGNAIQLASNETMLVGNNINKNQLVTPTNSTLQSTATISSESPVYLKILDDVLPTWEINCEMCEFDISDITFDHLSGLNVAGDPPMGAVKFGVKVGNVKELQIYPVFEHKYLSDRKLNGINRTGKKAVIIPATTYEEGKIDYKEEISTKEDSGNKYQYPASLQIAQNRLSNESDHKAGGSPFVENTNENTTKIIKGLYPVNPPETLSKATEGDPKAKTDKNTWIGNAIEFGTAYAMNFVNKIVDKAKIITIPNLGVSYSEVTAAIAAKNVVGALGLIRKGVNEVVNQYGNAPSSRLDDPIQTDMIMKEFLTELKGIPISEATDKDTIALIEAANVALSERGVWEKIKDYSLATNLVGSGEINIDKELQGTDQYSAIVGKKPDLSSTTGTLDINSGLPIIDPNAVSGNINQEPMLIPGTASEKLSSRIESMGINRGIPSSNLSGEIGENLNRGIASSNLNGEVGENLSRAIASERLSSETEGSGIKRGESSERLSSETQTSGLEKEIPSSHLSSKTETTGLKNIKASVNLSESFVDGGLRQTQLSGVSSQIKEGGSIEYEKPSNRISKPLEVTSAMKTQVAGVRTKTIEVSKIIEGEPTTSMNRKLEGQPLKRPAPSQATINELEKTNLREYPSTKATTSKIEQQELEKVEPSKATNQELFSK